MPPYTLPHNKVCSTIVYGPNFPPSEPQNAVLESGQLLTEQTTYGKFLMFTRNSQPKISKHKIWLFSNKNTRNGFHSSRHRNRKSQPSVSSCCFAMMPDSGIRQPHGCTDEFIVVFCVCRRMWDISFTLRQLSSESFPKHYAQLPYHSCLFNLCRKKHY
jgi:hypothetical protein